MLFLTLLVVACGMWAPAHADCSSCNHDSVCYEQPCAPPYRSCNPCAPLCGTSCGLSVCSVAAAIAAVVGVAAIIIASPGSSSVHAHN